MKQRIFDRHAPSCAEAEFTIGLPQPGVLHGHTRCLLLAMRLSHLR